MICAQFAYWSTFTRTFMIDWHSLSLDIFRYNRNQQMRHLTAVLQRNGAGFEVHYPTNSRFSLYDVYDLTWSNDSILCANEACVYLYKVIVVDYILDYKAHMQVTWLYEMAQSCSITRWHNHVQLRLFETRRISWKNYVVSFPANYKISSTMNVCGTVFRLQLEMQNASDVSSSSDGRILYMTKIIFGKTCHNN